MSKYILTKDLDYRRKVEEKKPHGTLIHYETDKYSEGDEFDLLQKPFEEYKFYKLQKIGAENPVIMVKSKFVEYFKEA